MNGTQISKGTQKKIVGVVVLVVITCGLAAIETASADGLVVTRRDVPLQRPLEPAADFVKAAVDGIIIGPVPSPAPPRPNQDLGDAAGKATRWVSRLSLGLTRFYEWSLGSLKP